MNDSRKSQAEAEFKRAQRAQDGKKAMSEYEAEAAAVRARTEKLKALRLARDGAQPAVAPASPARKGRKKVTSSSASLSDWLKERNGSGHNN